MSDQIVQLPSNLNELMEYIDISIDDFTDLCDKFKSFPLWENMDYPWNLKPIVSQVTN